MTIRLFFLFVVSSSIFFSSRPCTALGSASTLAISHSTGTICAVVSSNHTVRCARGGESYTLQPSASRFTSISGGRDFLCGLRPGPSSSSPLICWTPGLASSAPRPRRIYPGQPALEDITVGEDHVAAAVRGVGDIQWWRSGGRFPPSVTGKYKSLTSGNGFTCGIDGSDHVRCWGTGKGQEIEQAFGNMSMRTVEAGDSHACGITVQGLLRCVGRNDSGQLDAPESSVSSEFSALALGRIHTCATRKVNGTVVCWGGRTGTGTYTPAGINSFVHIVAGGDLTCGITTANFSVLCWSLQGPVETIGSLGRVLPGICRSKALCPCGELPDSGTLCDGTDDQVICDSNCSSDPPPQPSPQPPPTGSSKKRVSKGFLAFAIVGAVGCFIGLLSIVYCICFGVCKRKKKVHNSVQPAVSAPANGRSSFPRSGSGFSRTKSSSTTGSSNKSFKLRIQRQGSRVVMKRQRSGPSTTNEYAEGNVKIFTFEELSTATKCFALDTKVGSGSFGMVYRGKLADGREVAIKRRDQPPAGKEQEQAQQDRENEFQSEVSFLSRLHHKHLVGLIGYCEEGDERLLVYEFMKNGSLHDHIHPKSNGTRDSHHGKDNPLNSWRMRVKVLLDASRGVDYLHNYAVPPIIHRDIKTSNILLDATWTAKVSDFGLSLNEPETKVVVARAKKAGTVGYMDPEYYALHYLTIKSDVYGFGVVMLEVLTGKRAIFKDADREGDLTNVVDYASAWIERGEVSRVLDPRVPAPGPSEAEAVERVAYTALLCVNLEAKDRPTMMEVVANLEIALSVCEESQDNLSSPSMSFTSID